ncbi:MAG: CoA ester lyase [Halofilum sp. (in: g-proteobacteria)]
MTPAVDAPVRPPRLQRSELAVPGASPRMFERALASAADAVFLDLEDAVAGDDKVGAREQVVAGINDLDWAGHGKTVSLRVNGIDTHYMYRDLIEVVERAGHRLDTVLVPKIGTAVDVHVVDVLLTQIESACGIEHRIGIEVLIESALAMTNVEAIAQASPRLEAMHYGPGDYAASVRARTVDIGALIPDYPGDPWHYGLSRMTVACRAHGLRVLDGPYADFRDPDGLAAAAKRAAALGMDGKWAIHPSQIDTINDIFSPPEEEVARARLILEALEEAARAGRGAAQIDGKMIDAASARMAENVVRAADAIAARSE